MNLSSQDFQALRCAVGILENPSFAARLSNVIGTPIEKVVYLLPHRWSDAVYRAAREAIEMALDTALSTMDIHDRQASSDVTHKLLSGISGAVGGFFGTPALIAELPISTIIILRSIVDIAISEGEDLATLQSKLACLEVFALGGSSAADTDAEIGYYAIRMALANTISDAAQYIAERGIAQKNSPVLLWLISKIASRFEITVSQKFAAQAVPIIGAIGGASINLLFIDHFQDIARGHFIVRRLERNYGKDIIRPEYERLKAEID